jgi:hypothetical protein
MTHVAIVVPGIMGSQLERADEVVWPGTVWEYVHGYGRMDALMDPDLKATDVIRAFSISKQYQHLIDDLGACGFSMSSVPATLVLCPYDWRKDNRLAADVLAGKVEDVLRVHGEQVTISLICHSMGGLVGRFYLESGQFASHGGLAKITRLITLGTPHLGAPLALSAAVGDEKRLFLSAPQVMRLCSDPRYPSLYQLLPPRGTPAAWNKAAAAEFEPIDIYSPANVKGLNLVGANIESAQRFHASLDLAKRPVHVRYFFFVGTRQTTITSMRLLLPFGKTFRINSFESEDAGDGTVPSWSGLVTGVQGQPVGGEHGTIYKDGSLRRTMAALLGAPGRLAVSAPDWVEIAIRDRVVRPREDVHVSLSFQSPINDLVAELQFEVLVSETNTFHPVGAPLPLQYRGMSVERLNVLLTAPDVLGIYRLAMYASADPARPRIGEDELFVQRAAD